MSSSPRAPTFKSYPVVVRVECVRRSRERAGEVERLGLRFDNELRHYTPASIIFALKAGAWRVELPLARAGGLRLAVGVGPDGRERLEVASPDGADALFALDPCDH